MNFFRSTAGYIPNPENKPGVFQYSPGWYGTLDFAPPATVLIFNDLEGWCVGCMESELPPGVEAITEEETQEILDSMQVQPGVYFGDTLKNRIWDEIKQTEDFDPLSGGIPVVENGR